jgi:DNA-binding MarR family transcriptional regulator
MDEENKAALEGLRQKSAECIRALEQRPVDTDALGVIRELFNALSARGIEERTLTADDVYGALASMRRVVTVLVKRPAISAQEKDVLRAIGLRDPHEVTTAQIAARTMISRDSVNALVQSLLRKGLVLRTIRSRMGYHTLSEQARVIVAEMDVHAPVNAGALLPRPILVTPKRNGRTPHNY